MKTALLIQNETNTVLEIVKTSTNHYQITHQLEDGLACIGLTKEEAINLRDYLIETLSQEENW